MKPILIISVLLLLAGMQARPQQYYFRHYEVKDGLSDNSIECSIQDAEGFMWFGTKDGLTRFDGTRFKVFYTETDGPNLDRDLVATLAVDGQGTLWVGASRGLYRFDKQEERLVRIPQVPAPVSRLQVDGGNRLWVIAGAAVYIYELQSGSLRRFGPANFAPQATMCRADDGTMWFATYSGYIWTLNPRTGAVEQYDLFRQSPPTKVRSVIRLTPDGKGSILVGTISQGLKKFHTATRRYEDVLPRHHNGSSLFVHDILMNRENEIWLATEHGVVILNTRTDSAYNAVRRYLDPYSLSDNAVYTLCKDREGGIWAGTFFGGMNYYANRPLEFEKFYPDYTPASIGGNAVREICRDSLGYLWIATEDAGLTRLEPNSKNVQRFMPGQGPGSIAHSNIHGLMVNGNDLWISTHFHGIDVLDVRTGKVRKHYSAGSRPGELNTEFILTFLKTRNGNIYLGGGTGLLQYLPTTDAFQPVALDRRYGVSLTTLLEDRQGNIWAGTHSGGLYRYHPATGERVQVTDPHDPTRATATITALYEDNAGNIWAATGGNGLWLLGGGDPGRFRRFTVADGLPTNTCLKVLEDDRRTMWVTTAKGLVNMDAAGNVLRIFTEKDGLLNDQFNYNSGYKAPDGRLYFGSTRGMISFMPAVPQKSAYVPPLYITGLQVNNQDVLIGGNALLHRSILFTDAISLRHDQASINLDFAAISFTQPDRIVYTYKMEGIDQEWNTLQHNRRVYFTDLAPGQYVFRIRASGPDLQGVYEKQLAIRIRPPVWNTVWAYLLYALVLAGLVYYLLRSYQQVQRARKEKEIVNAKMEFFTNIAHEIRTPLTLIKGPVDNLRELGHDMPDMQEDLDTMERNTDRLIRLVNQVLDFRSMEAKGFSLNFEPVNISRVLREEFAAFQPQAQKRGIRYTLDLPVEDVVAMADGEALSKIFGNLAGNAVKYASGEAMVRLLPPVAPDAPIVMEWRNDGPLIPADMREKIFEPFFRLKGAGHKGTGIGLTLARSLAELHGGTLLVRPHDTLNLFVLTIPSTHYDH